MGSVDIPPFLREQQKAKVQETGSIPPFLKKKETEVVSEEVSMPSLSASASVGDGIVSTPPFQSEFQLGVSAVQPTIKKQSDKERYAAIENADANTLITQYDNRIAEQTTDIIENPFDFGKRKVDFEQSREGKVGKILKDFQEAKASANDLNYVAKVAPKAAKEIIQSVLPTVPEENLLSGEVIDAAIREGGKINVQRSKDKKVSDNRNIDSYISTQLSSFPDVTIDPSKIVESEYSEKIIKDISAKEKEELDILNNEFPERAVTYENNRGVTRTEMVRPPEYNNRLSQLQQKYGTLRNMVGLKAAYETAKKDPTVDPLSLGENWAKIARPDEYKTWQESNKSSSGFSRDMAQVGVNSLYGSENAGAVELAFLDERGLDDKYPEAMAAEVRHRLGAELNKSANWFLNAAPGVNQLDEAAKNLTQAQRDFYYKHIREEERRMLGTGIPQRGVANELGKGGGQALLGIVNYIDRKVGDRTSSDVAADALNSTFNTGFQKVGDFAPAVQRLKQINEKQKGGADLSKEEIKEKDDLESFTNVRSGIEKVVDGSFNLAGQVVVQALLTRGLGGIATKGVQGLGLLRTTNAAQGLTGLEAVAANATNFGVVTAPTIEKIIGGAIAYASSYDQAEQDAMRLMPGEENAGKRSIFTNTVGVLNAVTENIFRDSKVLDAFNREISPNVRVLVNKLTAGEIYKEALAPALTRLLKQSATFTKYATVENSKESFEETAVSAGTSAAIAILAPAKFNFNEAFNDAVGTFTSTFADGGLVGGFAAVNPTRAANIGVRTIASIGVNKQLTDDANSFINAQLANGQMTQEVANEKKQIINTAARINTMIMPEVNQLGTLSERSSAKYSVQLLNEKILSGKADETKDEVLKAKYQEQIKQSEGIRKQLLDNDVFVDNNFAIKTPEEINNVQRDLGMSVEEDLLPQLKENAPDIQKSENIQYFIDKAAEDPAAFMDIHGKKLTKQLMEQVPIEKLVENRDYLVTNFGESESTDFLTQIISQRNETQLSNINQTQNGKDQISKRGDQETGATDEGGETRQGVPKEKEIEKPPAVSVVTPQENKPPVVIPLTKVEPKPETPPAELGTQVQTSEPPLSEGVTPVTLSGLTEQDRQGKIQKRVAETTVTDTQKQTNDLLKKVKSYNSLPNGRLGKLRPAGLQQLNNIRLESQKLGLTFDERAGQLKTSGNRSVRTDNREVGDRAIAPNAVVLRDRPQQTQDVFNQLNEAGQFPNGYRLDNKQMSAAEIDGAIQDIVDGIPSERGNNYLNQIEKYIADDRFEIGNPGEIKLAPSLNELLGVQSEIETEPMTQESLESWLNEQSNLTPQQEQIVIDNIENLIQDYESAPTTEGVVQPTQPTTEAASSPAVEPNTEPVSTQAKVTQVAPIAETRDTVTLLTDELRQLLGNVALPYDVKSGLEISQDSRGKYFVTDINSKEPVSPAFDNEVDAQAFIDNIAKPLPFSGDTNPKNRVSFEDLGINENDTLETFIDKLINYGGQFTTVFNLIKADPNFQKIKLQLVNSRSGLENGESGLYYPVGYGEGMDNTLQIANKDNVYYTAAHELMHFMTLDSDTTNQIKNTQSYKALTDLYNYIVDKKGKPVAIAGGATLENYGLTNEKEFMAELLINPTFRKYVIDVFATNKDDIFKASKSVRDSKVNSIGDIIFNFFKDIFDKLFSKGNPDVPFDEKFPVVMNAAKLATDLFFGGQDIISTQPSTENQQGATILSLPTGESRAAALAFPSSDRNAQINTFVKSALDRGVDEADLKQALINNGISEADAQSYIDANKAAPATPQPESASPPPARSENEIISTVLNQRIDVRTFPSIFSGNETQQQIAAITQGAGQERVVDGPYVVALEKDLKEVSIQSAKLLRDELGKDWVTKTLSWLEKNTAQGNIAQVIGVLNIMSTENYQNIRDTHDGNRMRKLTAIQKRIDVVALQRARDASTGLRQRILYSKLYAEFGQGGNMPDVFANTILSEELQELQADMNEVLSTQPTDQELNSAAPIKTTKPKKKSAIRNVTGAAKRKANPAIKDELIAKGAETAGKTKKSFKELIEDAKNKLKNTKC